MQRYYRTNFGRILPIPVESPKWVCFNCKRPRSIRDFPSPCKCGCRVIEAHKEKT